jgi:hypothetical protein
MVNSRGPAWNLSQVWEVSGILSANTNLMEAAMVRMLATLAAALLLAGTLHAAEPVNDYPTVVRADYVFACMQVNGQTREALEKCSCSIDAIAALLPYDSYEEADTIMQVRRLGGEKAAIFLTNPTLRAKVDDLKRAQVEAELRCF